MKHRPAPLLQAFLEIVAPWRAVFPQNRSYLRALRQALAGLICLGRHTLSRLIWTSGGQQHSWSAEYFLHSRCRWEPQQLFATIWQQALPYCRGPYVGLAVDDTRLHKTGRRIRQAFFQRDPLSPPFHCNLMLGLRFLQASLLVPLYRRQRGSARALPVRFQEVSAINRLIAASSCPVGKRYPFPVEIFCRRLGLRPGSDLGKVTARAEPPGSRFCLSHVRPHRATSKPIGPRLAQRRSFADALFVSAIRSSATAAAASRLMTKTTIGSEFAVAFAICAAERSPSCHRSRHPTATTA